VGDGEAGREAFLAAADEAADLGAEALSEEPARRAVVFWVVPGDNLIFETVAVRPYTSVILILNGPEPAPPSMIQ
jgi:hypothetical protein